MEKQSGQGAQGLMIGLRPIVIVISGALVSWVLLQQGESVDDSRLGELFFDALPVTLEIAVVGTIVSLILGGALGLLARASAPFDRLLGLLAVPASSLAAPVVVVTLVYWSVIRFNLFDVGWVAFGDDALAHVGRLVLPTLTIAATVTVPIASSVRDTVSPWRPRPFGHDLVAPAVASRSGRRTIRLIGAPVGNLLLALLSLELVLRIPGVVRVLLLFQISSAPFLFIVIVGALVALFVDLGSLRVDDVVDAPLRQNSPLDRTLAVAAAILGGLLLAGFGLAALIGWFAGEPALFGGVLEGLFSANGVLGTDRLGRDFLHVMAHAAGPTLLGAVIPGLLATIVGLVAAAIARGAGPTGRAAVGLAVDVVWWPTLPLFLMLSVALNGATSTSPYYLAFLGVALIPMATRLALREFAFEPLRPVVACGLFALVTGSAAGIMVVFGFVRGFHPETWGGVLAGGQFAPLDGARLALIPGVAIMLLLLALHLLGAGLLHLGRAVEPALPQPTTQPMTVRYTAPSARSLAHMPPPQMPAQSTSAQSTSPQSTSPQSTSPLPLQPNPRHHCHLSSPTLSGPGNLAKGW